jgi:hypothetical protein
VEVGGYPVGPVVDVGGEGAGGVGVVVEHSGGVLDGFSELVGRISSLEKGWCLLLCRVTWTA